MKRQGLVRGRVDAGMGSGPGMERVITDTITCSDGIHLLTAIKWHAHEVKLTLSFTVTPHSMVWALSSHSHSMVFAPPFCWNAQQVHICKCHVVWKSCDMRTQ